MLIAGMHAASKGCELHSGFNTVVLCTAIKANHKECGLYGVGNVGVNVG